VEFAFLYFGIKTSLAEMLEYFFYMSVMFGHVIRVDEYIIQIDHNTNIQKVGDEWKWIAILFEDTVKTVEVNTKAQ